MFAVPDEFRGRPFARAEALDQGITARVLEGVQFVRIHENVYRFRAHEMSFDDDVLAASLTLPEGARTTGLTRLRQCGLEYGDPAPLHFVLPGDHHLDIPGIFLHRTKVIPPCDDVGVTPTAAFVAYCAEAHVIDAIKIGCWLLHRELLDLDELGTLAREQRWRWGVKEAEWVLPYLDSRCRSLPEAELLALILWSGLPEPEVNKTIDVGDGLELTPDFWWELWLRIAEYEGGQHQEKRGQYVHDIDRYATYRKMARGDLKADYVQITKETLRTPRITARRIFTMLVEGGYDGPAPEFGAQWEMLFRPLRDVVRAQARLAG